MSSEPATDGDTDSRLRRRWSEGVAAGTVAGRRTLIVGTTLLALVVVAGRTVIRLLANVPFDPVIVSPAVRSTVTTATPLAVAGAIVALAVTDDRPTVRVGLLFAGVFGLFGATVPAATLPAVVAVAGGTALALSGVAGRPDELSYRWLRRSLLGAGFVAAITVSLADSTGLVEGLHWLGSLFALSTVAAVGTRSERSVVAAGAGLLAGALVVYASTASPFVVGSALLVVFAVTGVPHLLFALAVAGGTAAVTAGLSKGRYSLAIGAGLVLLAGVPVTFPRAMTLLLGATLVALGPERPTEVSA